MSKAAKQSIFILIGLLAVSLGFGGYTLYEKQKLQEAKAAVEGELQQAAEREKKQAIQITQLQTEKGTLTKDLQEANEQAEDLRQQVRDAEAQIKDISDTLNTKVDEITKDRDNWKSRIDRITKERDDLLVKVQNMAPPEPAVPVPTTSSGPSVSGTNESPSGEVDEEYWAQIVKDKASLETEIDRLNDKISKDSVEIVDLKQKNQQLEMKLESLDSEKAQLDADIYDKGEMINRISLELARAKNDRKYEETQVTKLKEENVALRGQLHDMTGAKNALEKSILNITQDKVKMEKKLGQTETIIQSKIDEIWDIKESIDESFKQSQTDDPNASSEVELPPIVVKTDSQAASYAPNSPPTGLNGRVVSVNDENNFVIVDIGETQGLQLGDALSVYRDSKYIARLEVIQV